jgi:hypothetical protein
LRSNKRIYEPVKYDARVVDLAKARDVGIALNASCDCVPQTSKATSGPPADDQLIEILLTVAEPLRQHTLLGNLLPPHFGQDILDEPSPNNAPQIGPQLTRATQRLGDPPSAKLNNGLDSKDRREIIESPKVGSMITCDAGYFKKWQRFVMSNEKSMRVTEIDLAALPRWAIVAFATRCARRTQPRLDLPETFPDRWQLLLTVENAIQAGEQYIATALGVVDQEVGPRASALYAKLVEAYQAIRSASNETLLDIHGLDAARAVRTALAAVGAASNAAASDASSDFAQAHPHSDAAFAAMAYDEGGDSAPAYFDFIKLRSLAVDEQPAAIWDCSDSGYLGPLWGEDPPDWYFPSKQRMDELLLAAHQRQFVEKHLSTPGDRESKPSMPSTISTVGRDPSHIPISLYFDLEEFTPEQIEEQIAVLSDLYHAISDDELKIVGRTFLNPNLVPVED